MEATLTLKDCLSIGVGLIVGGGVITLTAFGIQYTGTGIFLAYIVAGIVFLTAMLPFIMVGLTIPRTSASYFYTSHLMAPMAGGLYLMSFFVGRVVMSFLGMSFAYYFVQLVPGWDAHAVAIGVVSLFYLLNLFGVKTVAKVQTVLNVILLSSLVLFIVTGVSHVKGDTFSLAYQFPNGWEGFVRAVALVMFPMGGALALFEFGGIVARPRRTLTLAVILISVMAMVLFAFMGLAGSASLQPDQFSGLTSLAAVSQRIFDSGAGHLVFMAGGALMAIATTINSSFSWYCNTLIRGCRDRWLPERWGDLNRFNVPYKLLTIFYALGIIPLLLRVDLTFLANVATGLALLAYIMPNFAVLYIAKRYPQEWNATVFSRLPRSVLIVLTVVCNSVFIGLIGFNFYRFSTGVFGSIIALLLVVGVYVYGRSVWLQREAAAISREAA